MDFIKHMDQDVGAWFAAHRTPLGTQIMRDITSLGGQTILTLIVIFTIGLLLAVRRRRTALFVLFAVVGGSLLADGLKLFIGRHRPTVTDPVLRAFLPDSSSFPSGHSMLSAVVYLTLALLLAGRVRGRRTDAYLIGWSLLLVFLIGASRLYLGVHYLTDVMAGWVFGLVWAITCRWIEDHWTAVRETSVAVDEGTGAATNLQD